MKTSLTLLGTFLLVISLNFNIAHSADSSGELTEDEEALWFEFFGDDNSQTQSHQTEPSPEDIANLSGHWVGYYEYDKPENQPETMFHVIIKEDDEFQMTFVETRNHPVEYVQAAIALNPKRQGKYITFDKNYGRSDSGIQYNLTIGYEGEIMEGTWKIDDSTYGRAFFYRLNLDDLKNVKRQTLN